MNKKSIIYKITMLLFIMIIVNCSSSDKMAMTNASDKMMTQVTYKKNIYPIMERSCTPCHFPERGKKELLDTYDKTKEYIDDIIVRIGSPKDSNKYMPFKSKRPELSAEEIALFVTWKATGMAE